MKTYEFTLKFSLPRTEDDTNKIVERLGLVGCNDALIGVGIAGRIAFNFSRDAESAFGAVSSAIVSIKRAIPRARLMEAAPDLAGLTEVADVIGCSRQNIRKIMLNSGSEFPMPVHEGKSVLWHLYSVLIWLKESRSYEIEEALLEVASVNMQINLARDAKAIDLPRQKRIQSLVS